MPKGAPLELTIENLPKFTVALLKVELESRGLETTGKKADLIARLSEELSKVTSEEPSSPEADQLQNTKPTSPIKEKITQKPASPDKELGSSKVASPTKEPVTEKPPSPVKKKVAAPEKDQGIQKPASPVKEQSAPKAASPNKEPKAASPVKDQVAANASSPIKGLSTTKPASPVKESIALKAASPIKAPKAPSPVKEQIEKAVSPVKLSAPSKRQIEEDHSLPDSKKPKVDNDAVSTVYVERFTRPLNLEYLKEFLGNFGNINHFYIDKIRSHCYVKSNMQYESAEEAKKAVGGIDQQTLDFQPGNILHAKLFQNSLADQIIAKESTAPRLETSSDIPQFKGDSRARELDRDRVPVDRNREDRGNFDRNRDRESNPGRKNDGEYRRNEESGHRGIRDRDDRDSGYRGNRDRDDRGHRGSVDRPVTELHYTKALPEISYRFAK